MGLAEPKRKVKYSIDPNALNWANNDNKFGTKLMEKMGWEKGKGLGLKEDGMTENIKVKFKSDTKGVGFNNNDYDNVWLDHQDEFESLLSSLKSNDGKPTSSSNEEANSAAAAATNTVQSLELKSKQSRARLHYRKFARSKDLSTVSENDLGCILGNKSQKRKSTGAAGAAAESDNSSESDEKTRPGFGTSSQLTTVATTSEVVSKPSNKLESNLLFSTNTMSIGDYFAQKMAARKKSLTSSDVNNSPRQEEDEEVQEATEEQVDEIAEEEAKEEVEETLRESKKARRAAADKPKDRRLRKLMKKSFKGSNFFDINGYSSYVINMSIEDALKEKQKLVNKKQTQLDKNLEKDPEFYKMNKKLNC